MNNADRFNPNGIPDYLKAAYRESDPYTESRLSQYWQRLTELLGMYRYNGEGELQVKTLGITPSAKAKWVDFYNSVESRLAPNGEYAEIKGFANKATEHAARLAGIIAVTDDPHTEVVGEQYMQWGIELAQFYLAETLRLVDARPDPDLEKAERLLSWLHGPVAAKRFKDGYINHTQIYLGGLRFVCNPKEALKYMMILERHGQVLLVTRGRSKLWKLSDNSVRGDLDKAGYVGKVGKVDKVGKVVDYKWDFLDKERDSLGKVDKVIQPSVQSNPSAKDGNGGDLEAVDVAAYVYECVRHGMSEWSTLKGVLIGQGYDEMALESGRALLIEAGRFSEREGFLVVVG